MTYAYNYIKYQNLHIRYVGKGALGKRMEYSILTHTTGLFFLFPFSGIAFEEGVEVRQLIPARAPHPLSIPALSFCISPTQLH